MISNERKVVIGWRITIVLFVLSALLLGFGVGRASASPSHAAQPYGGCKEAWQALHSKGANDCRMMGWTIWPNVVFTPRGRIVYCNRAWCAKP